MGASVRRILITGASGFIGGHVLRGLPAGVEVIALGRHRPEAASSVADWIEHDLTGPLNADRLPGQIDAIVHLAQSQVYREFPQRAIEIFGVNVDGTLRLLEYARQSGAQQFVFASSGGIYRPSRHKIAEADPIEPPNFYLASKSAAELLMRSYEPFFRLAMLRFFFVYGPGQQPGMLVPALVRKIMNREPVTIEGKPGLRINPIYVTDAVRAVVAALELPVTSHINVAGDEEVTITDLVTLIEEVTGKTSVIQYTSTERESDLVADTTRMKDVLGVSPRVSLVDGLRQTVQT
jgi:nucleoside-diphosphate-sugar epimerase